MPKAPSVADEKDRARLRSAATRLVETLRNANLQGASLRLKSKVDLKDLVPTGSRGWSVCLGTMGPELPRLEIWLDRWNGGKDRLFWFGFVSEKMSLVGKAKDSCKVPVARELNDNDWIALNGGATLLREPLETEVFNKPIVELYYEDEDEEYYFGIYNRPSSELNLELATKFFVPIIRRLLAKATDIGQIETAQFGFFKRLIRDRQTKFRRQIFHTYDNACAVTGCEVKACLEAAHIDRFSESFDNSTTNGILLRADLHRLMDGSLMTFIWSETEITVQINSAVKDEGYRALHNKAIRSPSDASARPSKDGIERHASKIGSSRQRV